MGILEGAVIGAVVGLVTVFVVHYTKRQRYERIRQSITDTNVKYAGIFHMASYNRYKKKWKFYDSYGALYLSGDTLYYKSAPDAPPLTFNLKKCTVQKEPDWKMLKWFSVTTVVGEKFYFNTHKLGAFVNNSDETDRVLELLKTRATGGATIAV